MAIGLNKYEFSKSKQDSDQRQGLHEGGNIKNKIHRTWKSGGILGGGFLLFPSLSSSARTNDDAAMAMANSRVSGNFILVTNGLQFSVVKRDAIVV